MDRVKIELEELVPRYIDAALSLVRRNLLLENFELEIRRILSDQTKLPEEVIKYLYNPFHHAFFVDCIDSPFRLIEPKYEWQSTHVGLSREVNPQDRGNLINHILNNKDHLSYLTRRIEIYSSNGFNTFRRQS